MKYYIDENNNVFANPTNTEGLTEILNPVRADGTLFKKHSELTNLPKDSEGNLYKYYNPVADENGVYQPDLTKIFASLIQEGEILTKQYVQSVVDAYNAAHNMHFESVYNCVAYKDIDTYPHQQFCKDVLAFNAEVWEKAREIQEDILAGNIAIPTKDEFIAMLPSYDGIN